MRFRRRTKVAVYVDAVEYLEPVPAWEYTGQSSRTAGAERHASGFPQRLFPHGHDCTPTRSTTFTRALSQSERRSRGMRRCCRFFKIRTQLPRPVCVRADGENSITTSAKLHAMGSPTTQSAASSAAQADYVNLPRARVYPTPTGMEAPCFDGDSTRTGAYCWPALPLPCLTDLSQVSEIVLAYGSCAELVRFMAPARNQRRVG
jgi:hypothetical protein